jgi:TonB family protein
MRFAFLLGIALHLVLPALLLPQSRHSTIDQEPPAVESNEKPHPEPGANHRPIDILSDTGGVDVHPYLDKIVPLIEVKWRELAPPSAWPPIRKKGKVSVAFRIMKDGQITDMRLVDKSGDTALDQAAYGGITASSPLPSMPSEFGCKYVAVMIRFYYNQAPDAPRRPKKDHLVPCVTTAIRTVQTAAVAISPSSIEVATDAKQQFSATITSEGNSEVIWTVSGPGCSGSTCGSISSKGLYGAPSRIPSPPQVIVTATLARDPTETTTATVTVVRPPAHR